MVAKTENAILASGLDLSHLSMKSQEKSDSVGSSDNYELRSLSI